MMDETVKTVLVDDSNTVHELVIAVAQKIGPCPVSARESARRKLGISSRVLRRQAAAPRTQRAPALTTPGISNPEEYSFTTEKLEEAAKMSAVKKTSDPKAVVKSDSTPACHRAVS